MEHAKTMKKKYSLFYSVCFLLVWNGGLVGAEITIEQLANTCQRMECAISDISMVYDTYGVPAQTPEEFRARYEEEKVMLIQDGHISSRLSAANLCPRNEANEPNSALVQGRFLLEDTMVVITQDGNSWENSNIACFDGIITKRLYIGGWPRQAVSAYITEGQQIDACSLILGPLGFSVLRPALPEFGDGGPLSGLLRYSGFVNLDTNTTSVNEFNVIRADILNRVSRRVFMRVYFSVDHGYTPVRYEYLGGGGPESSRMVVIRVDIHSLQEVSDGLWFPSSGSVEAPRQGPQSHVFQAVGRIVVNQGLAAKDFDIVFPAGTKVHDEIRNITYTIKPSEEQFDFPQ